MLLFQVESRHASEFLQHATQLPDFSPQLVLLDVLQSRVYIHRFDEIITTNVVTDILAQYKAKTLPFITIER